MRSPQDKSGFKNYINTYKIVNFSLTSSLNETIKKANVAYLAYSLVIPSTYDFLYF